MSYDDYQDEEDSEDDDYQDEEDSEDDDSEDRIANIFGAIVVFSFISMIVVFFCAFIITTNNDILLAKTYNITENMINNHWISSQFQSVAYNIADSYKIILNVIDYLWLASFVSFAVSGLVYAYKARRENLFSVFSYIVFGIIIFTYAGGIIMQVTNWVQSLMVGAFPAILSHMPKFQFYLSNIGIINLVLFALMIIANFIDLDMLSFQNRKQGGDLKEM